jgi:sterol 3beta-glucosyltransferase
MRVTIVSVGSRGDAQPYVALGLELARRGHAVTVATHEVFRDFVSGHGLAFAPVAGDPLSVVSAVDRWLATGHTRHALSAARFFLRTRRWLGDALLGDFWRVSQDSDVLVYSPIAAPIWSVAERLGIPGIAAFLQPLHRTRSFPTIGVPTAFSLGGAINDASHVFAAQAAWQIHRRLINAWRRDTLALPAVPWRGPFAGSGSRQRPIPTIYGFSPHVVARPADWPAGVYVTGYWVLPQSADWRPVPALAAFLDAGPPPVSIGFGSMTPRDAGHLTAIALRALALTGQRGVLLSGWGEFGLGPLPTGVITLPDVPHEWLFPQMHAVVHHGGSGTTGAGLRAGVPSVVVPLGFDQPYWGRRVLALGVGPAPIPRRHLTADRLASAIDRAVHDAGIRDRAARLGATLRDERGVERAVDVIEAVRRAW